MELGLSYCIEVHGTLSEVLKVLGSNQPSGVSSFEIRSILRGAIYALRLCSAGRCSFSDVSNVALALRLPHVRELLIAF